MEYGFNKIYETNSSHRLPANAFKPDAVASNRVLGISSPDGQERQVDVSPFNYQADGVSVNSSKRNRRGNRKSLIDEKFNMLSSSRRSDISHCTIGRKSDDSDDQNLNQDKKTIKNLIKISEEYHKEYQ